jgi:hypothetical protein
MGFMRCYGRDEKKIKDFLKAEVDAYEKKIRDSASPAEVIKIEEPDAPTLDNLLKGKVSPGKSEEVEGNPIKEYKSFVSFPVFLLHVLRVFYGEIQSVAEVEIISVDHKNLIREFENHFPRETEFQDKPFDDKQKCKEFIHCLLKCRLLMDNYMIKGHVDEGNNKAARWEIWSRLSSTEKKKIARTKRTGQEWNSITMLQSMMYFSQDITRVPWLTETLRILCKQEAELTNAVDFLSSLRQQDLNYAKTTLRHQSLCDALGTGQQHKGLGTDTPHYWFYKLEYCLWEIWFNKTPIAIKCSKPDILEKTRDGKNSNATFRMRHITSIEHVSPQSRNEGDIKQLDRFGNLALISVSANSSYSDKDPSVKASEFKLKRDKGMIESLKLAHIFDAFSEKKLIWDDTAMEEHENAMVAVLKAFHLELECDNNKEAGTGI